MVAKTTAASASWALVIQALVPLSSQWSPLSTAVVDAAPASLPAISSFSKQDLRMIIDFRGSPVEGR